LNSCYIDTHDWRECGTAAARALIDTTDMTAEEIAKKSMIVAADMCVYTNDNFISERLVTTSKSTTENEGEEG